MCTFRLVLLDLSGFQDKYNSKIINLSVFTLAAFKLSGSNITFPGHPQLHAPIEETKGMFAVARNGGRTEWNSFS